MTNAADDSVQPQVCIWRSTCDFPKFWKTDCGSTYEGSNSSSKCPNCGKQVALTGFDAWWEARKSYHP